MKDKWETKKQEGLEIVRNRLADEGKQLLYMALSGSHAWGLEREDSDVDFRGIYQEPTMNILSLYSGRDTVEFSDGVYDVQLYELGKFLRMLCKHNGNMVNLLWLPNPVIIFSLAIPWAYLARSFLTKKLRFYYRGYAEGQRKRAMSERGGKALIYTYREMFSGLHTMRYGRLEFDFMKLWQTAIDNDWYDGDLLSKYFPNPSQEVTDEGWHRFYSEWDKLCVKLDEEADKSPLPEDFDGREACSEILQSARLLNLFNSV